MEKVSGRRKTSMIKLRFIIIFILSIMPLGISFPQGTNTQYNVSSQAIENGFEKAMEKIEDEKNKEQEQLKFDLQLKLNTAVEDWISKKSDEKKWGINQFVHQKWEYLTEFGPRIHQDYYLRDYVYEIISKDIVESGSLINPYQGYLAVNEKLFVEMYHNPNASNIENYLFTVTTPIKINFQYNGSKFKPADAKYNVSNIEQGWPEEIKKKLSIFLRK